MRFVLGQLGGRFEATYVFRNRFGAGDSKLRFGAGSRDFWKMTLEGDKTTVTVVLPVFDEDREVASLVRNVRRAIAAGGFECEVVIVDDGSTNGCPWEGGLACDGVRVLHQVQRGGSGSARRVGTREARGTKIAWIDGDGTYAPEDLVRLLGAAESADQVIGSRCVDHGRWRILRLAIKSATCRVASWLWGVRIPDLNSGLRIFRRESLLAYLDEVPDGFSCVTTATLAALNRGQKVVFVPIGYHPRATGSRSKFHPVWDTLRLWRVIHRQWRARSRRRATAVGESSSARPGAVGD